jgi:arsenite-transporting ATPase
VANDSVFAATQRFYDRLDGVRELLTDPVRTSVRLVVNPERMVIAEARRTHTYLSLFGYGVDAVVANRLLPEEVVDPWFKAWKEAHAEHLEAIEEGFAPVPVLRAELAPDELIGVDRLRAFGEELYADRRPDARLHEGVVFTVEADGEDMVLRMPLPGADREELDLGQRDDELLVRLGPYRRSMILPDSLRRRTVSAASLDDGVLTVRFAPAGRTIT